MTYKSLVTIVFDDEDSYIDVSVVYDVTPAFSGSSVEPPHEAGVEIKSFSVVRGVFEDVDWIEQYLERDRDVQAQLLRDASEEDAAALDDYYDTKRREARDDAYMRD